DFVQGFYFAQPMTIREYEHLSMRLLLSHQILEENSNKNFCYNDLFFLNPEMKQSFDSTLQASVIYEILGNNVEIVRVNEAYFALLGHEDMLTKEQDLLMVIEDEFKASVLKAFGTCVSTKKPTQCDYKRHSVNGKPIWIHTMLKYISNVGDKHILVGELTDITMRRELDTELQKYKSAWKRNNKGMHTILIVDDAAINRIVLKKILCEKFAFLEAENGEKAISILKQNPNQVDIILLDIGMPVMDGKEFLQYKKTQSELDAIPVIMITADDSQEQQISTFSLGADDYIVKPFIPEVVTRRVANVLESNRRFQKMVEEYNDMSQQAKTDSMTGLINRASAEEMMSQRLLNATDICAMIMLDIDNFKSVNDTYGHSYGDKVICAIADKLRNFVQADNIVARMGGDEFAVFVGDIADIKQIENNAFEFCASTADIIIDGKTTDITCSIGIAITSEQINTFDALYKSADKALYSAKCQGRNTVSVYGNKSADTLIAKWINDAQSVFDIINDSIYACNKDTYELLYINENLCNAMGITQKSCTGKKCYEALMNRNSPCELCSLPKMTDDKVYTRIFKHPTNQQVYLLRGKNIDQNGIMVHLELAVDVSRLENINSYIEETNNYETR
ncbi:MAG: diguanylate cyclase, partial [Oscillospiraceae bacterium]